MLKRSLFLFAAIVFITCTTLFGQGVVTGSQTSKAGKAKYFLNKLEIAPQSVQFLKVKHIDSIRYYYHPSADIDTAIVLYSSQQDSIITFDDVMDDYFVVKEAKHFKINTPNYLGVEEPFKLVFYMNSVSNVHVYRSDGTTPGYINISSEFDYLEGDEKIRKQMTELINKFNNLPKPPSKGGN